MELPLPRGYHPCRPRNKTEREAGERHFGSSIRFCYSKISKNAACEGRPSPHNPYGGSRPFCSYRQPRPSYRCLLSYTGAKEESASNCCCAVSVATQTRSSTSRSSRPGLTLASACIKPNALDAAIRPRGQTSETTSTAQKYYLPLIGQGEIYLQGLQTKIKLVLQQLDERRLIKESHLHTNFTS